MNVIDDPNAEFAAVKNHEGQYALWPAVLDTPAGWRVLMGGSRAECLEFIEQQWTDMRPTGLRGTSQRRARR